MAPTRTPFLRLLLVYTYNTMIATTITSRNKITPTILNHIFIEILALSLIGGVSVVGSIVVVVGVGIVVGVRLKIGTLDDVGVACDVGCSGLHKNNDGSSDGEVSC